MIDDLAERVEEELRGSVGSDDIQSDCRGKEGTSVQEDGQMKGAICEGVETR